MTYLTKLHLNLHLNTPIFSNIIPKILLNTIEKKVVIVATVIFSAIVLLCFFIFSHFRNRNVVEKQGEDKNINFEKLKDKKFPQIEDGKIKKPQVKKEEQENKDEGKEAPIGSAYQPLKDQVSIEKVQEIEFDQKSKLIPKPIREMTYEENDIAQVFEIFKKQGKDVPINVECETYFKKAILLPKNKINIKTFYTIIDEQPELVDMMFNAAFDNLNDFFTDQKVKDNIYSNFSAILDFLYPLADSTKKKPNYRKKFVNVLQYLLNNVVRNLAKESSITCQKTIDQFFDLTKLEKLTTMILNTAPDPFNLIFCLVHTLKGEKQRKIVEASLPSFKDALQLERLYHASFFALDLFSPEQIEILFQHWKTTFFDENNYLDEISCFIDQLMKDKSIHKIRVVEDVLSAHPGINEKLIAKNNRDRENPIRRESSQRLLPYLSGFYVMRYLENKSLRILEIMEKMHIAIDFNDPVKNSDQGEDERVIFASFLAERCSNKQLRTIMLSLVTFKGKKQRMIESFLKKVLRGRDPKRIEIAFSTYWTYHEQFNVHSPNIEWVLLEEIDVDYVLRAVYQSIQVLYGDRLDKIKTLLRKGISIDDMGIRKDYKVKLPQETINSIVL